jgi:hypothetical protein
LFTLQQGVSGISFRKCGTTKFNWSYSSFSNILPEEWREITTEPLKVLQGISGRNKTHAWIGKMDKITPNEKLEHGQNSFR